MMFLFKIFLFLIFIFAAEARDFETIKKSGTIRVAAEGTLVPFNYYKDSKLTGFEVDLANYIFSKMNLKPEWKTSSFASLLVGLENNHYDITVASHAITAEREKVVDFIQPHYCSGPIIFSLEGGPKTIGDLKGKVVAAKVGTIYFTHLLTLKGLKEAKSLPNNSDLIQALLMKRVDAIILNEFAAEQMILAHAAHKFLQGERLMEEKLGMAVSKSNAALKSEMNKWLAIALKDGTYSKLSDQYFKRDIRCK